MSKCEIEMNTAKEKERLFKIFRANAQRSVIGVAIEEDDFNYLADAIIEEYANKQMKELLEWLEEYRLNTMSLMGIGDYEQGQIDVLTDVINRVDPNRCSYCGKDGFHNMSCPNNKERQKRLLVDIMKANELRIGNLIFEEETQEVGQVNTVILGIIDEGLSHTYKPIPLTEEWLERFNWNPPKDIGVAFSTNTHEIYFVAGNYYKTIEYVHQLQNLYFALTGEELKWKLN